MKLTVNHDGVFLDEQKIKNCTQVDVKNINAITEAEVVLHVYVDEADIQWQSMEKKADK